MDILAILFHFEYFLVLVFISITFHVAKDYRTGLYSFVCSHSSKLFFLLLFFDIMPSLYYKDTTILILITLLLVIKMRPSIYATIAFIF
jgi:hypothetical protein